MSCGFGMVFAFKLKSMAHTREMTLSMTSTSRYAAGIVFTANYVA